MNFNPLPPCGGRREVRQGKARCGTISIHSLRVEGDALSELNSFERKYISIHSLRVEGDVDDFIQSIYWLTISIHSLRVEGDLTAT